LDQKVATALAAAPYSYEPAGLVDRPAPVGYRRLEVSRVLSRRDLAGAARDLLSWRMHDRAGLRVEAVDVPLRQGSVVLLHLGVGPVRGVRIPCRVVEVIDEPASKGFVYGTLPGHPEAGEERFVLHQSAAGEIRFTISAVSRPATVLARLGGPLSRATQQWMTKRYLRALDRL
jgi:uncharacterized protein (UPF0548 family)